MMRSNLFKIVALVIVTMLNFSYSFAENEEVKKEKEFNVGEMIMHHIKDAHEWHLFGPEHGGTSIYLPVILGKE
jgi:F-type H+-transporting ATPase subunit a